MSSDRERRWQTADRVHEQSGPCRIRFSTLRCGGHPCPNCHTKTLVRKGAVKGHLLGPTNIVPQIPEDETGNQDARNEWFVSGGQWGFASHERAGENVRASPSTLYHPAIAAQGKHVFFGHRNCRCHARKHMARCRHPTQPGRPPQALNLGEHMARRHSRSQSRN